MLVDGGMSACPISEDVQWLCQRMCGGYVRGCAEGCEGCAENMQRMSGKYCKSVRPDLQ